MFVGIDNGLDGGLVALSRLPGLAPVATLPMPCVKRTGGREIDAWRVVKWMAALNDGGDGLTIGIEEPQHHAKSSDAVRSMWFSFGQLVGALAGNGAWDVVRVACGNRKDGWQRKLLGTVPKGRTKEYALAAARSIWPGETWLATPRSKVPHSGLVDAALIAEFLRRREQGAQTGVA